MMKIFFLMSLWIINLLVITPAFGWVDTDKDGVPDLKDACPSTPVGVLVDASGCDKNRLFPPLCLMTTDGQLYPETCAEHSETVLNFDFAKADILFSQWKTLAQIKQFMQQHDVTLCVIGHTDSVGNEKANQRLSEVRSLNVVDLLVDDYGFDSKRFTSIGMGTRSPVGENETPSGRALNRRVNFLVELTP